jgi:beta-lactam-binding protein with PASTA domain
MDTTVARSPIGHLLNGRYRVESHLARGGMADVYLGTDTRLERPVALKIMRAELASDEDFVRRFIGEARSVARLSHPNVVAVFDQGADGRTLYLAMEYVRGQSLRALLTGRGRLPPAEALDIMEGVLAALAAAHEAGLAHRDVKPENVLLTQAGAVKVVDFGLARLVAGASHTKTGMLIGTAAYLAPEQVARGAADARSDVYAAGIVLFELLTGSQPHTGDNPLTVAYKHVNEVVPAPSSVAPGLPPALDMLVAMATSRDPDLRPADAGQFLGAIAGVRRSLPAPPAVTPIPGGRWPSPGGGLAGGSASAPPPAWPDEPAGSAATDLIPGMAPPPAHQSYGVPAGSLAPGGYRQDSYQPPNQTLVVSPGGPPDLYGPPEPPGRYGRAPGGYRGPREPRLQRLLFSRRLAYLAGGLAVAVAAVFAAWWLAAGRYATVPRVTGQPVAAARADLRAVGLTAQVTGRAVVSDTVPKGDVIRTSPGGGSKVGRGGTVTLVVSAGPRMIIMPEVTGQALAAAQAAIRQAHLVPGTVTRQTSATIPAGIVISTDPMAGVSWPQPKPVQLTVSAGPPLPDFVGQQKSVAEQWTQQNGVSLNEVTVSSNQPAGVITHQAPPAGDPFSQGEVITVSVSSGPPMVAIPNVDGMPLHQAQRLLRRLGFQVNVNQVGPLQTVFNYSPNGQAPQGSTITLFTGLPSFG